jgi:hypothetical protein
LRRTLRLRYSSCFGSLGRFALCKLACRSPLQLLLASGALLVGAQRCLVLCVLLGSKLTVEVLRQTLSNAASNMRRCTPPRTRSSASARAATRVAPWSSIACRRTVRSYAPMRRLRTRLRKQVQQPFRGDEALERSDQGGPAR